MTTEKIHVYIPVEEYRELVKAKVEAECLKAFLNDKLRWFRNIQYEEVKTICEMFGLRREHGEDE